ncbi:MAG: hypothetical protein ACI8S6_003503 [Myxococcota bacterium]|jgi:hypothetical protein
MTSDSEAAMTPPHRRTLGQALDAFMLDADEIEPLLRFFYQHCLNLIRRRPPVWWAPGEDSDLDAARDSLAHRTFVSAYRRCRSRPPFVERTAFECFHQDRFPDPKIRAYTFYSQLSVAAEEMKRDYRANIRADPALRWCDELYRQLGPLLQAHAEAVPRQPLHPRSAAPQPHWVARREGLSVVSILGEEAVVRRLSQEHHASLTPALVTRILTLRGRAMSRTQIARIVAAVLPPPAVPEALMEQQTEQSSLRIVLARSLQQLEPLDRTLLMGIARAEPTEVLLARDERFRRPADLNRRLKKINTLFANVIAEACGAEPTSADSRRETTERILAVLLQDGALLVTEADHD